MENLIREILTEVAAYLSPLDAIGLNVASTKLHSQLSMAVTAPRCILNRLSNNPLSVELLPSQEALPSTVVISIDWTYSGRGGFEGNASVEAANDREGGESRPLHASDVDVRDEPRLKIMFRTRPNESYRLRYVGEGDNFLYRVTTQTLAYECDLDDPSYVGKTHLFLVTIKTNPHPPGILFD